MHRTLWREGRGAASPTPGTPSAALPGDAALRDTACMHESVARVRDCLARVRAWMRTLTGSSRCTSMSVLGFRKVNASLASNIPIHSDTGRSTQS